LAEDISKQVEYKAENSWLWLGYPLPVDKIKIRIKPTEPVFEWQWLVKEFSNTSFSVLEQGKYYTDNEVTNWYEKKCLEETKRKRK